MKSRIICRKCQKLGRPVCTCWSEWGLVVPIDEARSSLKRRPGDRAVNPGGGDRRRKELTGIFERYKKGMTWSHSPESWPFLRRTPPSLFWSRVQKFAQNSHSEQPNHKLFQWFMRQFPTYRKRVFISAKWGIGRVASGNFSTWIRGSRISV